MADAVWPSFVGLVDVDALHGATEGDLRWFGGISVAGSAAFIVGLAADGVIENEDFRGAGTREVTLSASTPLIRSLGSNSEHVQLAPYADFKICSISG